MAGFTNIFRTKKVILIVLIVLAAVIIVLIYYLRLNYEQKKAGELTGIITNIAAEGNATGTESIAQEKAKPYLDEALRLNYQNPELLTAIGYLYETDGKYQDAIEFYKKAQKVSPNSGQVLFRLAHATQFLQGNTKEVQDLYNEAYKLGPKDPLILQFQAKMAMQNKNPEKAMELYMESAKNTKRNDLKAEAYVNVSLIREAYGNLSEAKKLAKMAVDTDRNYGPGLVLYGMAMAREGKFNNAAELIVEGYNKNQRASMPLWYLGSLMRLATNYKQAMIYFNMALDKIASDNTILGEDAKIQRRAVINYEIGKTHYMNKEADEAFGAFAKASALNKDMTSRLLQGDFEKFGLYSEVANEPRFLDLIGKP